MSEIDTKIAKLEEQIKGIMSRPTYSSTPAWHQEVAEVRLKIEEMRSGRRSARKQFESPVALAVASATAAPTVEASCGAPTVAAAHTADDAHADDHPEPNYMAIFFWLTLFTLVELGLVQIVSGLALAIGLTAFAMVKVALVAMYYMHLKFERKIVHFLLTIPIVLVVIMILLLVPDAITVLKIGG